MNVMFSAHLHRCSRFSDGGSKAAFYCIVQNLFDRLLIDGQIALENFVSDVCQRRVNALISLVYCRCLRSKIFACFVCLGTIHRSASDYCHLE